MRTSLVTYVTMVPRVGNETLRPLGVALRNAVSVTHVWSMDTKTQLVGRRQPMTSLPARPQYKSAPGEYIIHLFIWSFRPKHGTMPRGRSLVPHSRNHGYISNQRLSLSWELRIEFSRGRYVERYTHVTMLRGVHAKTKANIKYQLYRAKGVSPGTAWWVPVTLSPSAKDQSCIP